VWVSLQTNLQADSKSWEFNAFGGALFKESGLGDGYRYLVAYYWGVTTLLSGSSYLVPGTVAEIIYAITYVLLGCLFASSMISSLSASLVESHEHNRAIADNLSGLRTFLAQRECEPMLGLEIMSQAEERLHMAKKHRLLEEDVVAISLLSAELRSLLKCDLLELDVRRQPLWAACVHVDGELLTLLCEHAIQTLVCAPGHEVFSRGASMEQSYVLAFGTMQYALTFDSSGE
jgi:hypothetical protein